jgi:hypothetical protein
MPHVDCARNFHVLRKLRSHYRFEVFYFRKLCYVFQSQSKSTEAQR